MTVGVQPFLKLFSNVLVSFSFIGSFVGDKIFGMMFLFKRIVGRSHVNVVLLHFNSLFKFVELLFLLHISLLPNVSFFVRGYILLSNRDKDLGIGLYRLSIFEGETIDDYPGSWSTQGLNSFYSLPYSFPNMPKLMGAMGDS